MRSLSYSLCQRYRGIQPQSVAPGEMGPKLPLSTYSQEFSYPAQLRPSQPRPSSAHRRNNPHPRPDFLLPRKLQTGYGQRTFATNPTQSTIPLLPPVRHISVQVPEGKPTQTQAALKSAHTNSNTPITVGTLPPPVRLHKAQPEGITVDGRSQDSQKMKFKQKEDLPPLKPSKPTSNRSRSRSSDSSSGYSCFHVLKPYKAGYYIIHPEFMSEWLH